MNKNVTRLFFHQTNELWLRSDCFSFSKWFQSFKMVIISLKLLSGLSSRLRRVRSRFTSIRALELGKDIGTYFHVNLAVPRSLNYPKLDDNFNHFQGSYFIVEWQTIWYWSCLCCLKGEPVSFIFICHAYELTIHNS